MSKKEIFRKSSLDRVSSPEKLNDYIKVSNPAIWLVILALFILLIVGIVWASVGTLPTKIKTLGGTFQNQESTGTTEYVRCFVPERDLLDEDGDMSSNGEQKKFVKVGQSAEILPIGADPRTGVMEGKVVSISGTPVSRDDGSLSPELRDKLNRTNLDGNLYPVFLEVKNQNSGSGNGKPGSACSVNIVVSKENLLSFLSN
ncbi:MAG: hypothetical protein LBH37_01655 [Oscillospiraceae bacterium]|jgi:hypothetical protein|nr:hypothetical protein [Oscillospiraceae bacterium]